MNFTKMYFKSKENITCLSFLGVLLFVCSFFIESSIFKIFSYISLFLSIFCYIYIFYKLLMLNYEVKNNVTTIIEITIDNVKDIFSRRGWRQCFAKDYFGIKIISTKNRYLYFYKKILNDNSDFSLYNKIENVKKIKIVVYRRSKIVKKIITKL